MVQRLSASTFLTSGGGDSPVYAMDWKPEWTAALGGESATLPRGLFYVADPLSWSVIVEMVVKAIIAEVAKEVAKKIVDVFGARTTRDVILEFFNALVAALQAELREQWLEETTANTTSLKRLLEAYSRSPESRAEYIPIMITKAEDAFAAIERIGTPALAVASLLAAMRFSINGMQARISGTDGDWETCARTIPDFQEYIDQVEVDIVNYAVSRVGPVREWSVRGFLREGGPPDRPDHIVYGFDVDGRTYGSWTRRKDAEAARQAVMQGRVSGWLSTTIVPAQGVIDQMKQSLEQARA